MNETYKVYTSNPILDKSSDDFDHLEEYMFSLYDTGQITYSYIVEIEADRLANIMGWMSVKLAKIGSI